MNVDMNSDAIYNVQGMFYLIRFKSVYRHSFFETNMEFSSMEI